MQKPETVDSLFPKNGALQRESAGNVLLHAGFTAVFQKHYVRGQ